MEELLRTVEDRQRWKIVVHDAVNPELREQNVVIIFLLYFVGLL